MLDTGYLLDRFSKGEDLPTIPGVALAVLRLAEDPDVRLNNIADVVAEDPALTGRLLRLANSSFFGRMVRVGTIKQALVRLGLRSSLSVVLGFSIAAEILKGGKALGHPCVWHRSLLTSVAAKRIAEHTGKVFVEEAFTASLLQDIGLLALVMVAPGEYIKVEEILTSDATGIRNVDEVEREVLGTTHMELSSEILAMWNVPDELVLPVGAHHTPQVLLGGDRTAYMMARIMQTAEAFARLICPGPTRRTTVQAMMACRENLRWPPSWVVGFVKDISPEIRHISDLMELELPAHMVEKLKQAEANETLVNDLTEAELTLPKQEDIDAMFATVNQQSSR